MFSLCLPSCPQVHLDTSKLGSNCSCNCNNKRSNSSNLQLSITMQRLFSIAGKEAREKKGSRNWHNNFKSANRARQNNAEMRWRRQCDEDSVEKQVNKSLKHNTNNLQSLPHRLCRRGMGKGNANKATAEWWEIFVVISESGWLHQMLRWAQAEAEVEWQAKQTNSKRSSRRASTKCLWVSCSKCSNCNKCTYKCQTICDHVRRWEGD